MATKALPVACSSAPTSVSSLPDVVSNLHTHTPSWLFLEDPERRGTLAAEGQLSRGQEDVLCGVGCTKPPRATRATVSAHSHWPLRWRNEPSTGTH